MRTNCARRSRTPASAISHWSAAAWTPVSPQPRLSLERLDAPGLKALIEEVADALAGRTDGDGLNIETTSHMVLAYN